MGNFISISGNLVCNFSEQVPVIRTAIMETISVASDYGLSAEVADLYMSGWSIPEREFNFRNYISYGGHIRSIALDYLQYQILFCLKAVLHADIEYSDVTGIFYIIYDEGDRHVWEIYNDKLNIYQVDELDGRSQFKFLNSIEI